MQIYLCALVVLLILLFLLIPAFRLKKRMLSQENETFVAIDGATFWSSRWGKVKVYGAESPKKGGREFEDAKGFLSSVLKSGSIKVVPIGKNGNEGIVATVTVRGEDLGEKIRQKIEGH